MAKRIKSGIKRVEVAERNRQRNVAVKSAIKSAVRHTQEAIVAQGDDVQAKFQAAVSLLDKAVTKGVLHRKAAARRKSRLAKKFNAAQVKV